MTPIDNGGIEVFAGEEGDAALPMGVALYKRPADGAVFAIVSRKTGPSGAYLWQYRLEDDGSGQVTATKVREFGTFSDATSPDDEGVPELGEIEAVAVDDALGYLYYSDELTGVRKYLADPDAPDANVELALFATEGFAEQREGISIYTIDDGTGYILVSDQQGNAFRIFRREGEPGAPHDHRDGHERERRLRGHQRRPRRALPFGPLRGHVRRPHLPVLLLGRHRRRRPQESPKRSPPDSVTLCYRPEPPSVRRRPHRRRPVSALLQFTQ